MTGWYESHIDRQIREAQERGEFDDLPGAGKPLESLDEVYDENWWIKNLVRRDKITGALPASLLLRREYEDVLETVATKKSEWSIRRYVEDLNERIAHAQRGHVDGPPVLVSPVDVEEAVRAWRRARGLPAE